MAKMYYLPLLGRSFTKREMKAWNWSAFSGICTFSIGLGILLLPALPQFQDIGKVAFLGLVSIGIAMILLSCVFWRRMIRFYKTPFNTHRTEEQKRKLARRAARNK